MRWCPAPNCEYAIHCAVAMRSLDVIVPTVQCACGHVFCFGCSLDGDHRPCCCPIVKRWLQKCKDDSETSNWISANTKECTKCHSTIEKNGGCNVSPQPAWSRDRRAGRQSPFPTGEESLISHVTFAAHDLQEVQVGILLGLHGPVERARHGVVQLLAVRGEGRHEQGRAEQEPRAARAVPSCEFSG